MSGFQCKSHGPNCTKDLSKVAMYGEMICDTTAVAWLRTLQSWHSNGALKLFDNLQVFEMCHWLPLDLFPHFKGKVKLQLCRGGI